MQRNRAENMRTCETDASSSATSAQNDENRQEPVFQSNFVNCVQCHSQFSSQFCCTSIAMLKAMLFDTITNNSVVELPYRSDARSRHVRKRTRRNNPCSNTNIDDEKYKEKEEEDENSGKENSGKGDDETRENDDNSSTLLKTDLLLPFCEAGFSRCSGLFSIEQSHWICVSCMAQQRLHTASPTLLSRMYAASDCDDAGDSTSDNEEYDRKRRAQDEIVNDATQTTTTTTTITTIEKDGKKQSDNAKRERSSREREHDQQQRGHDSKRARILQCDVVNGRYVSQPSIPARTLQNEQEQQCPKCAQPMSPMALAMFLVICEAQAADYVRMRRCWIEECVRNVKLRKLIRDLQHYLLFDESLCSAQLALKTTPQSYCVQVQREIESPAAVRNNDRPVAEQRATELLTAIRSRSGASRVEQLRDAPPLIACRGTSAKRRRQSRGRAEQPLSRAQIAENHGIREPRERWLFEALNLHNDFDEATMPINSDALTVREQRALRRSLRNL